MTSLINTIVLSLLLISSSCFAESSVWKVSKNDKYFYIAGTIHLLDAKDHPLPKEFDEAYKDSSHLIFETDITESQSPTGQQKMLFAMMDNSGKSLSEKINSDTYQKLAAFMKERGLPINNFAMMEPWAVALTITVMEYQRLGLQPQFGVDAYFAKRAAQDKKTLGSLETLDEQISYLGAMGKVDPNQVINYTLRDLKQMPEFVSFMKTNWRSGNIEAFSEHKLVKQMRTDFPEFYGSLITTRNNNWMPQLLKLNSNDIVEFVLVGTMHLNGEVGLLSQLKQQGFNVDQL